MIKKNFEELLTESKDVDKDIRIMAANDLCQMLLDDKVNQNSQ